MGSKAAWAATWLDVVRYQQGAQAGSPCQGKNGNDPLVQAPAQKVPTDITEGKGDPFTDN